MGNRDEEIAALKYRIQALEKTNKVLIEKVEKTIAQQGSMYSLFAKNSLLQRSIDQKTAELDEANLEVQKQKKALDEAVLISETDHRGIITYANENFCKISGYSKEELIGKPHNIVNSDIHPKSFWEDFWKTLKAKKVFKGEICNKAKNGELYWVESTIFPVLDKDDNIKGFTSVRVDITEKKMNQQSLIHSEKLASLGEMAAGVGHEINNPLAICMGNIEIIKRRLSDDGLMSDVLLPKFERISEANVRIKNIVDGLRVYSRNSGTVTSKVSLKDALSNTVDLVKEIYQKEGIELQVDIPEDRDFFVEANLGHLQQVVMNLISNAKDATEKQPQRIIGVRLYKSVDDKAAMSISDNGCGIPQELISKITQPFFTTKEVGKGTGIGLGVVNQMVKESKGELLIESEPGEGSTFTVKLPLLEQVAVLSNKPERTLVDYLKRDQLQQRPKLNGRVLVVDDEEAIREVLTVILTDLGYQVDSVANGFVALQMLQENKNAYDIVCTDMKMPVMKGCDFIKKAQLENKCQAQFYVISGNLEIAEQSMEKCPENLVVAGYIRKPFTEESIYDQLSKSS